MAAAACAGDTMAADSVGKQQQDVTSITDFDSSGTGLLHMVESMKQKKLEDLNEIEMHSGDQCTERYSSWRCSPVCIGKVVHVDNQRLAHIAVEVTELGQYCLACKGGMLENVLLHQDIHEENKTPALHGLEEGLQNWRSMNKVASELVQTRFQW